MPLLFITAASSEDVQIEVPPEKSVHQFNHLPIGVFDVDDQEAERLDADPRLRIHRASFDSYLPILRSIDHAISSGPAMVANISISHGPGKGDPREPVNLATWVAASAGVVLVIAAGNDGPNEGSLSPWAQMPWVIGVGAANADGTSLLPSSSIGWPDKVGPAVVAHGVTVVPLRPFEKTNHGTMVALVVGGKEGNTYPGYVSTRFEGTSVAAPRVARIATLLLSTLRAVHDLAGTIMAALPNEAMLADYLHACDKAAETSEIEAPGTILHGLSRNDAAPLIGLVRGAAERGLIIVPSVTSSEAGGREPVGTIRRMIESMACPIAGYGRHQVGSGFVSDSIADAWLARLRPADFLRLRYGSSLPLADFASDIPLFTAAVLERIHAYRDKPNLASLAVV